MQFEFTSPARILFGPGSVRQLNGIIVSMGNRVLCTTNIPDARAKPFYEQLSKLGLVVVPYAISGEPTVALVSDGVKYARQNHCDLVIGFGGGSAIDAGKAIAALITNGGDLYDYLEVIGKGVPITIPPVPMIAIPTTAGTGAEVTRNAVISVPEQRVKVSLRSSMLLPKIALVDPELTQGLPPNITASTGLDALTQLIEPFVSVKANPLTDAICRQGIRHVAKSLRKAYEEDDPLARQEMSLASLFGGLALANSGLGAVHGFASVLGGMYSAPHGVICARLLPIVVEANVRALHNREPESPALKRYDEIAQLLTGNPEAQASDGINWVKALCDQLNIPALSSYGIHQLDYPQIIEKTMKASSTKANPIQLSEEEMSDILESNP